MDYRIYFIIHFIIGLFLKDSFEILFPECVEQGVTSSLLSMTICGVFQWRVVKRQWHVILPRSCYYVFINAEEACIYFCFLLHAS